MYVIYKVSCVHGKSVCVPLTGQDLKKVVRVLKEQPHSIHLLLQCT